jgi:hypothetical protein
VIRYITETVTYPSESALMFYHVLPIAAPAFIAFILAFAHPASHARRGAVQQTAAHGGAATGAPPYLAASK